MTHSITLTTPDLWEIISAVLAYNGLLASDAQFFTAEGPVQVVGMTVNCQGKALTVRMAPEGNSLQDRLKALREQTLKLTEGVVNGAAEAAGG